MDEYEASIRRRFPQVILAHSKAFEAESPGEAFEAFLVPAERLDEFRAFVADDLAALAGQLGRPPPRIVAHPAAPAPARDPYAEFR
jgi:hypothetical protein